MRRNKGPTHPPSERASHSSLPVSCLTLFAELAFLASSLPPSLSPSLPSFLPGTSHKMLAAYQVNDLATAVERGEGEERGHCRVCTLKGRVSITRLLLWLHRIGELDSFPEKQSSGRANQQNMFSTKHTLEDFRNITCIHIESDVHGKIPQLQSIA